mmetsp:Transcript_47267/g.97550  ORF Transcript_47267/g.97550 Transcript_47267/m.97550 type:complete len:244 (-) Transcript_47267:182-913(-)
MDSPSVPLSLCECQLAPAAVADFASQSYPAMPLPQPAEAHHKDRPELVGILLEASCFRKPTRRHHSAKAPCVVSLLLYWCSRFRQVAGERCSDRHRCVQMPGQSRHRATQHSDEHRQLWQRTPARLEQMESVDARFHRLAHMQSLARHCAVTECVPDSLPRQCISLLSEVEVSTPGFCKTRKQPTLRRFEARECEMSQQLQPHISAAWQRSFRAVVLLVSGQVDEYFAANRQFGQQRPEHRFR